jgi:septum formation protein
MVILASSSPRRQELLRNARVGFEVHPAQISEERAPGEAPLDYAGRVAKDKAEAVFAALGQPADTLVLGADTIVVVEGEVLGKPADDEDAVRMLRRLSGRAHEVITGVCLAGRQQGETFADVRSETTRVFFVALDEKEIRDYVATGEPMDKAGAYAIQGVASRWIPRIEGDYFNVVGLPVALVCRVMREHGE